MALELETEATLHKADPPRFSLCSNNCNQGCHHHLRVLVIQEHPMDNSIVQSKSNQWWNNSCRTRRQAKDLELVSESVLERALVLASTSQAQAPEQCDLQS